MQHRPELGLQAGRSCLKPIEVVSFAGRVQVASLQPRTGFREFDEEAKCHSDVDQFHVKLPDILERLDASYVSGEYSENHKIVSRRRGKITSRDWPLNKPLLTIVKSSMSGPLRTILRIHSSSGWRSERSRDLTDAPFLRRYPMVYMGSFVSLMNFGTFSETS